MHKLISLIAIVLFVLQVSAQMDDKFYYPSHEWKQIDSLKVKIFTKKMDEDEITAYLISPDKKPKATIIYFHGAGGNVSTYIPLIKSLVKDGFQVFMVDFRGYGKSTGKPTHLNIESDGQKILDFSLTQKAIKNTNILLYGASMGTQIATHLAALNESKISGLILDGTISSFTDIASAYSPPEQKEMIEKFVTSPYSAKEDIKKLVKIPVLFIHSKEDEDVPFSQYELVEANCTTKHESLIYTGKHLECPLLETEVFLAKVNYILSNK
ncbi:alpha/beta hydrolase [Fluviicola taffensis]|uniref:Alpha/beta hydrolase fold protein n=1 Tax=Fluviicola taffensis (strain DSM 16823 / NCIMB 13979 / RW262) TaxID=755732 RepID=F2IES4_FLUTR|nr:alpha/beta fold hydrolase [Fluviicola taffensis]AEA45641.1 alpha/beta hydrolase fold protein [Fluviicola taffensis DSM 16823]